MFKLSIYPWFRNMQFLYIKIRQFIHRTAGKSITWMILPCILTVMPLLIFGSPGFYGDDFDLIFGIEQYGYGGFVQNWISNYGIIYRPIGFSLAILPYEFFSENPYLLYWISWLFYSFLIIVLFRQLWNLTNNLFFSSFAVSFFALFPLNPTAFLQLPSMIVTVAIFYTILLIGPTILKRGNISGRRVIYLALLWMILLLTYEQMIGLVIVIVLIVFLMNLEQNSKIAFQRSFVIVIVMGFISIIFFIGYITAPNNPKMVALKKINIIDSNENRIQNSPDGQLQKIKQINKALSSRYNGFKERVVLTSGYLVNSINYSLGIIFERSIKGIILIVLLLLAVILCCFIPVNPLDKRMAKGLFFVGFTWAIVTISPFLLYDSFHMPPYSLMIPSIGLGIFSAGLLNTVFLWKNSRFSKLVAKCIFGLVLAGFSVSQYGYYFSLREELAYWNEISEYIKPAMSQVDQEQSLKINNIPEKKNRHVFWLEGLIGQRYLRHLLDDKTSKLVIHHDLLAKTIDIGLSKNPKSLLVYKFDEQ